MTRRLLLTALVLLLASRAALAVDPSGQSLLRAAWPDAPPAKVSEIGRGIGVVFSPDLSVPNNCRFYEALGFACFQDADWSRILDQVHDWNGRHPEGRVGTLVLETHGTNGNGLKVQTSYAPSADRSYVAIGALQERLERAGIYYVILSACNSMRLLRPSIYTTLDPHPGDKLFLPATCGIVDASPAWSPRHSPVTVITPESSHIETTVVGSLRELSPAARRLVQASAKARGIELPREFAVSDVMAQMIVHDPELRMTTNKWVDTISRETQPDAVSERLFRRFLTFVDALALRESGATTRKGVIAARRAPRKPTRAAATVQVH
jgi:hypothetical protein